MLAILKAMQPLNISFTDAAREEDARMFISHFLHVNNAELSEAFSLELSDLMKQLWMDEGGTLRLKGCQTFKKPNELIKEHDRHVN